ncbi:MAG: DUF6785 family protein, partial [Candidatus Poribacteria bacterium]
SAPAPAPLYILLAWILVGAPALRLVAARASLSRSEVLTIYAMLVAAGTVPSHEVVGFMLPHMASVHFNASVENEWSALFHQYLRSWLFPPAGPSADFAGREGSSVAWVAWRAPLIAWSVYLLALFFVMICVNSIVSRQWIRRERLTFPLTAIALQLTDDGGPRRLIRMQGFWLGAALPVGIGLVNIAHGIAPAVPAIQLRSLVIWAQPTESPWSGLGAMQWNVIFWLIGVAFIVPTDISLSCWVFHFITRAENVAAVVRTGASQPPSVYSPVFPALFYQGMGALLGMFVIVAWTGRGHWRHVIRSAAAGGEYRLPLVGMAVGLAFLCLWCSAAGMSPVVAFAFVGVYMVIAFVMGRVRVETGLGILLSPLIASELMYTMAGTSAFSRRDLTTIASLRWSYFAKGTMGVMPAQLEGFKIAEAGGFDRRKLAKAMYAAILLAVVLAVPLTLMLYHDKSFTALRIGDRTRHYIGSQSYWAYQNLTTYITSPTGPSGSGITAVVGGFGAALALAACRFRYAWWSLHPAGYMAANSWGMHIYWSSFFTGWLVKTVLLRSGGFKAYRSAFPWFMGLIMGDILSQGATSLVRCVQDLWR